ncbi:cytochrome c biogenesis protein ResB [bacterium]|nr:cytochrome c biogenesis protein ResB [bacterium]
MIKRAFQRFYDIFSSTRLAVWLSLGVGVIIVIGTILPQKGIVLEPDKWQKLVSGSQAWAIADRLGFLEVFHAWYFYLLLFLFFTNLIIGSVKGLTKLEENLETSGKPLTPDLAQRYRFTTVDLGREPGEGEIASAFSFLKAREVPGPVGEKHWFGEFGRMSRFMPYVLHFSFIVIGLGAVVSGVRNVEGRMFVPEGRSVDTFFTQDREGEVRSFALPFAIRCDDFDIEFYEGTEQPKDFRSALTVIENGETIRRQWIEVNEPLDYRGFRFFQAFYQELGVMARVQVTRDGQKIMPARLVTLKEVVPLSGTDGFTVIDYAADHGGYGPSIKIRAVENDMIPEPFWVTLGDERPDAERGGVYAFEFLGLETVFATGLQVSFDPGVKIVWAGAAIMIPSLLWALFGYHHRVWVRVDGRRVEVARIAHKRAPQLEANVESALARLSGEGQARSS